jgi:hypothetical protein
MFHSPVAASDHSGTSMSTLPVSINVGIAFELAIATAW